MPAGTDDSGAESVGVKESLRRLAGIDDGSVIERADRAVDDLEAAAEFVDTVGITRLETAVRGVDDPDRRERGHRALEAFRRFRAAASDEDAGVHFHSGRGTDKRRDAEESTR